MVHTAILHREAGRYKEAIAALRAESPPEMALLSQLLSLDGRDSEAWSVLRAAQAIAPECPMVRRTHARLLLKSGQLAAALVEAEAACRAAPEDAEAILVLASALASNGRGEAATVVEHALRRRPDYAEALALRGMLTNTPDDLEAALRTKPHLTQLWNPLAGMYHRSGRLGDAKMAYLNAIDARPRPDLHNNLGAILVNEGRAAEALVHFDRAIELDSGLADAHSNRGKTLKDLGRLEDAESACRRAIELAPKLAGAHNNLAVVLQNSGRLEESISAAAKALSIAPDLAEAQYNRANALYYLDEIDAAKEAFWKTSRMSPSGIGLNALVSLACFAYAERDLAGCRRLLEKSARVVNRTERVYRTSGIYWQYLGELLKQPQSADAGPPLHVVGDSHSLSAAGVAVGLDGRSLRCVPVLIKGCKQWHLGNDRPNEFKVLFGKVMARLSGSILLTIGEIDCRPNEGAFAHWRKNPGKALNDVIERTISRFLGRIDRPLIVSGVPAPTSGDVDFLDFVTRFNDVLREGALLRGMRFLDVHAMTNRGDGLSNGRWHIDPNHLIPDAMREAFSKYLR